MAITRNKLQMKQLNGQISIDDLAIMIKNGFDEMGDKFTHVNNRLGKLEGKVDTLDGRVNKLDVKVDILDGKVNKLDVKVDKNSMGIKFIYRNLSRRMDALAKDVGANNRKMAKRVS